MSTDAQKTRRTRTIIAAVVALLVGIGGGALASTLGNSSTSADQAAGEIILAAAADPGPDPFSQPISAPPDPKLAKAATTTATTITAPTGQATTASTGGTAGLYGGTKDQAACDAQKMVDFLAANPDKAKAWVDALNADPDVKLPDGSPLTVATIPQYVATLTPLVLMQDTRVTNHGYKNGKPTKLQAVLQKGSAVLVDNRGVPRVRCYCGNPLLPPVAAKTTPKYTGKAWPDFNPTNITVVQINNTVINNFTVTDLATGKPFTQTTGSTIKNVTTNTTTTAPGATTTTAPGATTTTPTTTAPTTTAPTTTAPAPTTTAPQGSGTAPTLTIVRLDAQEVYTGRCPGKDLGDVGYKLHVGFTDPDGDGNGTVRLVGEFSEPKPMNSLITGDGSTGAHMGAYCLPPGRSYEVSLTDLNGNTSITVTVEAR